MVRLLVTSFPRRHHPLHGSFDLHSSNIDIDIPLLKSPAGAFLGLECDESEAAVSCLAVAQFLLRDLHLDNLTVTNHHLVDIIFSCVLRNVQQLHCLQVFLRLGLLKRFLFSLSILNLLKIESLFLAALVFVLLLAFFFVVKVFDLGFHFFDVLCHGRMHDLFLLFSQHFLF